MPIRSLFTTVLAVMLTLSGAAAHAAPDPGRSIQVTAPDVVVTGDIRWFGVSADPQDASVTGHFDLFRDDEPFSGIHLPFDELGTWDNGYATSGTHDWYVTFTPDDGSPVIRSNTVTVREGKRQSITYTQPPEKPAIEGSWTPAPEASSGLEVQVDPNADNEACEVAPDGVVWFASAGTCSLTFSQPGNDEWLGAPDQVVSFEVRGIPTHISVAPGAVDALTGFAAAITVVADVDVPVSGTLTLGLPAGELSRPVLGGEEEWLLDTGLAAGDYDIPVSFTPFDDTIYQSSTTTWHLEVRRRSQSITVSDSPDHGTVGGSWRPSITAGGSGSPVTVTIADESADVCSVEDGTVAFDAVGDCTVWLDQAGDADWAAAERVELTVAVQRRDSWVELEAPDEAVVGQPVTLHARSFRAGSVAFAWDGHPVGAPVPVRDGIAELAVTPQHAGAHDVGVLLYPADDTYAVSSDSARVRVAQAPTTTTMTITGEDVAVAVAPTSGTGTPTGRVGLLLDGEPAGTADLVDGVARIPADTGGDGELEVAAEYAGDADFAPSRVTRARRLPTISAALTGSDGEPVRGWSDGPVTATFTCAAPDGLELTGGCPEPVTVEEEGTREVERTVIAGNGGRATATATVRIDATAPTVRLRHVQPGKAYHGHHPDASCAAADELSGPAGECTVTRKKRGPGAFTLVARASDRAGNTARSKVRYRVVREWAALKHHGRLARVVALSNGHRPALVGPTRTGHRLHGDGPRMVRHGGSHGQARWVTRLRVGRDLAAGTAYRIGIRRPHAREVLRVRVPR